MTNLFSKKIFFTLIFSVAAIVSKAQIGFDYAQYDLGLGGAYNKLYGDAESTKGTVSAHASFIYNETPYVNYVFEVQAGSLEGGNRLAASGRYFKNNFTALVFRGQLQAGEIIDYSGSTLMNAVKNLYLSTGVGYILNNIKDENINRVSNTTPQYVTGGLNKSNELYIPARIGYEFKFYNQYNQPSFKVDVGYQVNFDLTDNMDGFTAGARNDTWVQFSIGVKFALGGVTSYRKSVQ
ncbi:hypothetical protein ACFQZX_11945 [Mucilaginibacter litoreus]|uniref:Outer membrane protein beta-barrel domain-containing protein n=1 Tax=Mucilaginibacter litoreus TaxID=1048221 RepID=A0ABW3AV40_9SPHI